MARQRVLTEMAAPKLTRKRLETLLRAEFPEMFGETGYALEKVWHGGCLVRRRFHPHSLRPGGTISGPTIMALADFAMYVAVLSAIGWVPLAVTTNLTINFLQRPPPADLLGEAHVIKLGSRLVVGEIGIRSRQRQALVAHSVATYSVPDGNKIPSSQPLESRKEYATVDVPRQRG